MLLFYTVAMQLEADLETGITEDNELEILIEMEKELITRGGQS